MLERLWDLSALIMCWDFVFTVLKCNEIASVSLPDYQWRWLPAHGPVCCASVATLTTLGIWQGSKRSSPACKNIKANALRERLVVQSSCSGLTACLFVPPLSYSQLGKMKQHEMWVTVAFPVSLGWGVTLTEINLKPHCVIRATVL